MLKALFLVGRRHSLRQEGFIKRYALAFTAIILLVAIYCIGYQEVIWGKRMLPDWLNLIYGFEKKYDTNDSIFTSEDRWFYDDASYYEKKIKISDYSAIIRIHSRGGKPDYNFKTVFIDLDLPHRYCSMDYTKYVFSELGYNPSISDSNFYYLRNSPRDSLYVVVFTAKNNQSTLIGKLNWFLFDKNSPCNSIGGSFDCSIHGNDTVCSNIGLGYYKGHKWSEKYGY